MKAWVNQRYGEAEVLSLRDIDRPSPGTGEVRVRVRAVSLNASDREFLTGSPGYIRMAHPFRPSVRLLGSDVAGTVDAVGPGVTHLAVGDDVFGDLLYRWGCFAEYVCAPEERFVLKPPSMTFEVASTLPQASLVALQGLDWGGARERERTLIIGAGGGAGTFAIQIARSRGAHVTGVDRAGKLATIREAGADEAFDYTAGRTVPRRTRYDRILDLQGSGSIVRYRGALTRGGRYVLVGGPLRLILQAFALGPLLSLGGRVRMGMLVARTNAGLERMIGLVESRTVVPWISKVYSFDELREAMAHFCSGTSVGKLVVRVPPG